MIAISLLVIAACMVIDSIERRRNHGAEAAVEVAPAPSRETVINRPVVVPGKIARAIPSQAKVEIAEPENLSQAEVARTEVTVLPAPRSEVRGPQPVGYSVSGISTGAGQLGEVVGRITLKGTPPAETVLNSDPECSGRTTPVMSRTFSIGESNGLADAVVFVRSSVRNGTVPAPNNVAMVSFTNCEVQPYVTAVMAGQLVDFLDGEGMEHKLYLADDSIKGVLSLPPKSEKLLRVTRPHLFVWMHCLEHSWETAYVCVMENPFFAVTDSNGNFKIPNVPPGKYTVEVAHQRATGPNGVTRTLVVSAGRKTELNMALDVPSK